MATISFVLPTSVANFLNLNVPGFASASGGGGTIALQVPSSALPAPVIAGLSDAGIQVPSAAVSGAPASAAGSAPAGLAQFAPAGLVPQAAALEDTDLAAANAFAQSLAQGGAAANTLFQQLAANPPPANLSEIATWATAQQQAVLDYFGGV